MFKNKIKQELLSKIELLEKELQEQKKINNNITLKNKDLETYLKEKENMIQNLSQQIQENQKKIVNNSPEKCQEKNKLSDKGYLLLEAFKTIPPFLDKVIGKPFIITVAEEFNYQEASDKKKLDELLEKARKVDGDSFHCFRDELKLHHSFRVTYSYSSKEYTLNTPEGKKTFYQLMFPEGLASGLELNSNNKSAIYLALKNKGFQSAILPDSVFGAYLLSYAFPVFDNQQRLIGAISFSNDITQIVKIAQELGNIVSSDSDSILSNLARLLKEELDKNKNASQIVQNEALFTQKTALFIREKGQDVINIAERLKVLALNTAIEATKVGGTGKGVGIIATQMRNISEQTGRMLKEIAEKSKALYLSSQKVFEKSNELEKSASQLKEESSILFDTSLKITTQKDELASLVRMSIDEITQTQEELNNLLLLIKKKNK